MAETGLAFHAAPSAGRWLNDPNGLVFADGAFRIFAQHRVDAPDFRETGWARFSSDDLLNWRFEGMVIHPDAMRWAYSGCVMRNADGSLTAVHTEHEAGLEHQVERTSSDAGLTWGAARPLSGLGPAAQNRRDPFVFADVDGWALLLAEPCDWADWSKRPPSRLRLYRSTDRVNWRASGTIGPWRPKGLMWEVPVLARIDGRDVLIVSEVDRRGGGAACSVRGWVGSLTSDGFARDDPSDNGGQLLDCGPDFYAMIANAPGGWPIAQPMFVGWLSNWQTARTMAWPGFTGGPISIPRMLALSGGRLEITPVQAVLPRFSRSLAAAPAAGLARIAWRGPQILLEIRSGEARITLQLDARKGLLSLGRIAPPLSPWLAEHRVGPSVKDKHEALLFVDGPALELFVAGIAASFHLASAPNPIVVIATSIDDHPLVEWYCLV